MSDEQELQKVTEKVARLEKVFAEMQSLPQTAEGLVQLAEIVSGVMDAIPEEQRPFWAEFGRNMQQMGWDGFRAAISNPDEPMSVEQMLEAMQTGAEMLKMRTEHDKFMGRGPETTSE